jgi:hypothetical protein
MNPQIQLLIVQDRHRTLRLEAEAEHLAALVRPASTTHSNRRSTGPGVRLTIVRRFVARLAGA